MTRLRDIYLSVNCKTLGDTICATPSLRKMFFVYGKKINVVVPDETKRIWINNPYIEKLYNFEEFNEKFKNKDWNHLVNNEIEYYQTYVLPGQKNQFGIERKFQHVDLRQIHANDLGFQLFDDELECDFFPNKRSNLLKLPKDYIVIHPSTNWPNRTWNHENWQSLIDFLTRNNIFTVVTGKTTIQQEVESITEKRIKKFNNLYGLDLSDQLDLSDTWHLLNNAKLFITLDSGLLHLAGTTDTFIIQLGSAKDPRFSSPYRKGTRNYKYLYIKGKCDLFCTNNMKYGVREWGTMNNVPPLTGCLENKPTFECHSSVEDVTRTIEYLFKTNLL